MRLFVFVQRPTCLLRTVAEAAVSAQVFFAELMPIKGYTCSGMAVKL